MYRCVSIHIFYGAPFKDHNFQFPTVRRPLRICLLHVTSPYSRKIAGGLGRAKQCNCKQSIQELIHALSMSVFDESIMWLRRLDLFTDILRYIYSAQFALNELEFLIYR